MSNHIYDFNKILYKVVIMKNKNIMIRSLNKEITIIILKRETNARKYFYYYER